MTDRICECGTVKNSLDDKCKLCINRDLVNKINGKNNSGDTNVEN